MVPSSSCTDWMMDFKMASSPALPWPYAPQMMVPSRFLAFWRASPLQDALVNLQLVLHHPVDGELPAGFFVDALPKGVAQFLVPGQGQQVLGQLLLVAGLENQPVHTVVDEHRHAPHPEAMVARCIRVPSVRE